jgi:hypothetical protein
MKGSASMMVEGRGQTIEIFLIDGKPDGMLTARIIGQEGRLLKTPRAQISDALKYAGKASSYTGVYLLFGEKTVNPGHISVKPTMSATASASTSRASKWLGVTRWF